MPCRKLPTDGTKIGRRVSPRIKLHLRHVLVLEAEAVELESRRAAALVGLDHRAPAAAVAADGVDGDRVVRAGSGRHRPAGGSGRWRRSDSSRDWRPGAPRRSPRPGRAPAPESRRPSPAPPDARSRRRAPAARPRPWRRPAPRSRARASSGRQSTTRSTSPSRARLAAGSLRRSGSMLLRSTPATARSRSRMPRPVVPASPSMNTAAARRPALKVSSVVSIGRTPALAACPYMPPTAAKKRAAEAALRRS